MFSYKPPLEPEIDYFKEYIIPEKIEKVCKSILHEGCNTKYQEIYDAIYELVENDLIQEKMYG